MSDREDGPSAFDPMQNQLAGLDQYPSVRRLRAPSYLRARRSRADQRTTQTTPNPHDSAHLHRTPS